jgi:hypothetical protein
MVFSCETLVENEFLRSKNLDPDLLVTKSLLVDNMSPIYFKKIRVIHSFKNIK